MSLLNNIGNTKVIRTTSGLGSPSIPVIQILDPNLLPLEDVLAHFNDQPKS